MSTRDELDLPNPANVREVLSSDDTLPAIKDFQSNHGILLPSLKPALPLLDLHGISRLDFHRSVFEEFRSQLLSRIREISSETNNQNRYTLLGELLNKTMPAIKVKILRPIIMCLMQQLPSISDQHLQVLVNDKDLYKEASIEVKQQIWMDNQSLFGDEVSPHFTSYIDLKEDQLTTLTTHQAQFYLTLPKTQRNSLPVQQLVSMVGRKECLYEMVLQFIRTLFLRMTNRLYCTLRSELLMSFHDKEVTEILSIDPCHKFAWCLDACVREKFVDHKRARELQGFLDSVKQIQGHVLGDISMILCDPHSIHTLATSIIKNLAQCVNNDTMPRGSEDLQLLVRLLCIGVDAWEMINNRNFNEPKPDATIFTKVLPCVASLLADDLVASISGKNSEKHLDAIPAYLSKRCQDDLKTSTIVLFYAFHTAKHGWVNSLCRVLPLLHTGPNDLTYHDSVLYEFVYLLSNLSEHFHSNHKLCSLVFDGFFVPMLQQANVCRQLMRLLWFVHGRLPATTLDLLMQTILPHTQNNTTLESLHAKLTEKIKIFNSEQMVQQQVQQQQQQQASNNADFLQSPLSSVPTPHPHL